MKKLVLFIFSTLLSFTAANSLLTAQVTNANLSNYAFWDTEPFIAVNPVNPNNVIAAWMHATGFGQISIATKYSTDGGVNWSGNVVNMPHTSGNFTSADVSMAFNSTGTVFLAYVDYKLTLDSGYVYVISSGDGGATWNNLHMVVDAMETSDLPVDRPWIACDRSGTATDGNLYIVSKSYESGAMPHHVWMKSSSDDGITWSALTLVDNAIPTDLVTNAMGSVTVGPDGAVYVAYPSWHIAASPWARMIVVKSTDGGANWTPYVIGNATANSAINDSLLQGSFALAANPANSQNLVMVFTDNRNTDADIFSTKSIDGGVNWSAPFRITTDNDSNGNNQDMCWAAFSQSGVFVTAWRDRRNSAGGSQDNFEIFATASADDGATFAPEVNISSAQSPYINIVKGNDFIGVCSDGNYLMCDWADYRTGNTEIFFNRTSIATILGMDEQSLLLHDISLYPNPAEGAGSVRVDFSFDRKLEAKLEVISLDGKRVFSSSTIAVANGKNSFEVNVSALASGSYLLVISGSDKVIGRKMFVK